MTPNRSHFYVDESGDLSLFDRRGRIVVGMPGVSTFFMVGLAEVAEPHALRLAMRSLRESLLSDPYLTGIPSMRPDRRRTAICFHAKNDCPEVRWQVFKLLRGHDIKIQVAIRRKAELAHALKRNHKRGVRWQPDGVYDDLIKRIFKNVLHRADENVITVARRGKSDRLDALTNAIRRAQRNFYRSFGRPSNKPTKIDINVPSNSEGLQAVDYCLWALQRLFERGEDRYYNFLADKFRLVMDLDDTRNKQYGEWYSDSNPLSVEKIKPAAG